MIFRVFIVSSVSMVLVGWVNLAFEVTVALPRASQKGACR